MSMDSGSHAAALERLSALVDGELDGGEVARACSHWRESAASRSTWHAYQLIGDVLRSDDLACDPTRDAGFLEAVRARLAAEPVRLAPERIETSSVAESPAARVANGGGRRWSWKAPSAAAAGFIVLVGILMLPRTPGTPADPQAANGVAQFIASTEGPRPAAAAAPTNLTTPAIEPQTFVANGQLIRDARLDRYLAAHKQFAGSSALGVPSAFLRNATAGAADR